MKENYKRYHSRITIWSEQFVSGLQPRTNHAQEYLNRSVNAMVKSSKKHQDETMHIKFDVNVTTGYTSFVETHATADVWALSASVGSSTKTIGEICTPFMQREQKINFGSKPQAMRLYSKQKSWKFGQYPISTTMCIFQTSHCSVERTKWVKSRTMWHVFCLTPVSAKYSNQQVPLCSVITWSFWCMYDVQQSQYEVAFTSYSEKF